MINLYYVKNDREWIDEIRFNSKKINTNIICACIIINGCNFSDNVYIIIEYGE